MRQVSQVKPRSSSGKRSRPVTVDELPAGAMPTASELRKLRVISAQVASGKMKVRYVQT